MSTKSATAPEILARSNHGYISAPDTAILVRAALKRAFPNVKFRVRTSQYSMGASIHVGWTDGPTSKQVQAVTDQFVGGRFDGMIDLAYSVEHYLTDDGKAVLAHSPGTVGSRGVDPGYENPDFKGILPTVHFGADHIFADRTYSNEGQLKADIEAYLEKNLSLPPWEPNATYAWPQNYVWQIMSSMDFLAGDTIEKAFRREVLREEQK